MVQADLDALVARGLLPVNHEAKILEAKFYLCTDGFDLPVFEANLFIRLGFPAFSFFESFYDYFKVELCHLKFSVAVHLSCFVMLCEC